MPFTTINVGDQISPNLDQILLELKTALNEREVAFGISQTIGWYVSGKIEVDTNMYVATIRSAIAVLLVEHDATVFLKLDGVTEFANISDLLIEAGYPSGWITLVGGKISNRLIYVQLQNVFLQMLRIRKTKAIITALLEECFDIADVRQSISPVSEEDDWDGAVAGEFSTTVARRPNLGYSVTATARWTLWSIFEPHAYDTSGWPTKLGALVYARHTYFVNAIPNGNTSGQMVVELNGGDETITITMTESADGVGTADLVSGFTFGVDYVATAETVDPANQPWTPLVGKSAGFYFNCDGTASGDRNVPVEFLFNLTSAMTYG